MRLLRIAALFTGLSIASLAGCVHTGKTTPEAQTYLRVENQGLSDATVYVWENSSRRRLGRAGSLSNTTLLIPSSMVFGATQLRFQLDFLAGNRTPLTESITVAAGDTVILQIPPH